MPWNKEKQQYRQALLQDRKPSPCENAICQFIKRQVNRGHFRTKHVALFFPLPYEVDLRALIPFFLSQSCCISFPCCSRYTKQLSFHPYQRQTLWRLDTMGIPFPLTPPAPSPPSVLFVPALGMDKKGHRIGYGKGYYDATLRALRRKGNNPLTVGVTTKILKNIPSYFQDIPLNWGVTKTGGFKTHTSQRL